jgi:hypothetical protein
VVIIVETCLSWSTVLLQAGKSRVPQPLRSLTFFNWPNPSSRTKALGSSQPLTEMSAMNLPLGKDRPAREADNLIAPSVNRLSKNCGNLDVTQPYGLLQGLLKGLLSFFTSTVPEFVFDYIITPYCRVSYHWGPLSLQPQGYCFSCPLHQSSWNEKFTTQPTSSSETKCWIPWHLLLTG